MQTPEEYEVSQRIGLLIKGLKHQRGMSREDICRHLGIGMRTLDNYLNGVSSFKLGTLMRFADLCRVKLADILDDTEALSRLYPDNMKNKGSILTLILGSAFGVIIFESTLFILLLVLFFYSYKDKNSQLLTLCFVVVFLCSTVVAYALVNVIFPILDSGYHKNICAFTIQFSLSLLLLFLLKYRMAFAVFLTRGRSPSVFEKNYAEGPLHFLVLTLALIDFFALMENFLRNLEHLGINEETAKVFWEVTFFYDYFAYLKSVPMLLCVAVLYIGYIARNQVSRSAEHVE
ncbi:helix-turn-helix domain-containing protein [Pseudoalteromonas sp. L23]|uniref:helix-turn-helix domain-containing protein n=1 Tax=unclassified Pseudoalteromonas TaxID=194690 RepID=UPI001EF15731|nr:MULTISPECIES: helix-turn-helix transcriptional regulator [unclassified Pseudoalteromonas]MCF7515474.1 helix-turn-helix domain-containing protein [Pseudoalteromonas sp. L7]MCF7527347.1 helix-turn-helix domain-containing protein [Pseudoalteromonas sp. L23]